LRTVTVKLFAWALAIPHPNPVKRNATRKKGNEGAKNINVKPVHCIAMPRSSVPPVPRCEQMWMFAKEALKLPAKLTR
jgi:hypothetical protein